MNKRFIRYYLPAIILAIILSISFFRSTEIRAGQTDDLFPFKEYGDLRPRKPRCKSPSRYQKLFLDKQGLIEYCMMPYGSKPREGSIVPSKAVFVQISEYQGEKLSVSELQMSVFPVLKHYEEITINDSKILAASDRSRYHWLSFTKYITVTRSRTEIPNDILADLTTMHPSDVDFTIDEIDPRNIIEIQIERSHEIIKDAEPMRILPARITPGLSRSEAYIGMVAQCVAETMVRCWSGMCETEDGDTYADCPITLISEDISRKLAWKKFREETMSLPIIEKNVNWTSVPAGGANCRFRHIGDKKSFDDPRWLVLDELKMSPKELASPLLPVADELPDGIMPEMFE